MYTELLHDEYPRIRLRPMYYELGFSHEARIFMHADVKQRLIRAVEHLPEDYGFVVWDAYRSREVQARMFEWMMRQVGARSPELKPKEIFDEAAKYMSPPTKVGDERVPPHLSGGAIDLTLYHCSSDQELLLGTLFDDCSERAHALYFEQSGKWTENDILCRDRRRILRDAMTGVDFTVYRYEWWHFDYGNAFWSESTGNPSLFGPLFGDAEGPCAIPRT